MENRSGTFPQMSFAELRESIGRDPAPPAGCSRSLQALWHDARGDWDAAHRAAQDDTGPMGAWVHAYLHRKEGDRANAGYWYRRAGKPEPAADVTLEAEWEQIARALTAR